MATLMVGVMVELAVGVAVGELVAHEDYYKLMWSNQNDYAEEAAL